MSGDKKAIKMTKGFHVIVFNIVTPTLKERCILVVSRERAKLQQWAYKKAWPMHY